MQESVFLLDKLYFSYNTGQPLFKDLSLEIKAGESVSLLGANGSGKSTLLKLFCALEFPEQGQLWAFGQRITEKLMENDRFSKEYHSRIGFIFQNPDVQLFTTRVWDEIEFGPLQLGLPSGQARKRVEDVLEMLQISHLRERSPHRLVGEKRKKWL